MQEDSSDFLKKEIVNKLIYKNALILYLQITFLIYNNTKKKG